MKVIVHIGAEKTGTSSIQKYLYKNRRKLQAAGFHFLQSGGKENSRGLAAYCRREGWPDDYFRDIGIETEEQRDAFRRDLDAQLKREIGSLPSHVHTVVVSSEHFSSRLYHAEEMGRFKSLLQRFFDQINIVCYIREQVRACESWYSTTLKAGGVDSLQEFMQRCHPGNYYFNYHEMLSNWESHYGIESVSVAVFSREHFVNGDLLDDFTARLDQGLVGKLSKKLPAENESLSPAGQALARAVNVGFPVVSAEPEIIRLRDRCKVIIYRRLKGGGQVLSQDRRLAYSEPFLETNEKVRQRYFQELDVLFPPPSEMSASTDVLNEQFEQALNDILKLVRRNRRRIGPGGSVDLFGAIATSIADMISGQSTKAARTQGKNIILNDNDAQMLSACALRIEGKNVSLAQRLMQLAAEINPDIPSIRKKLAHYRESEAQELLPMFLLTYRHGGVPDDPGELETYQHDLAKWANSLLVPMGPALMGVDQGVQVTSAGREQQDDPLMGAYSVIQAMSLEDAVAITEASPYVRFGGVIDVMPLQALAGPL